MVVDLSKLRLLSLFFFMFIATLGLRLLFALAPVHAITGAPSNFFPDVNTSGAQDIQAIVQIVSANEPNYNTKMKARTTIAAIYVPENMIGQTINMTIIGGCDGSGRDANWWNGAATYFYMSTDVTSPLVTSKACGSSSNKDISYSFIARANLDPAPVLENNGATRYYVQTFEANAVGTESGALSLRYLNAFQLRVNTGGVYAGLSTRPRQCDIATYPLSCPPSSLAPPTGYPSASYSYSSFYGPSSPTNMGTHIAPGCSGGTGELLIYDLDSNDASLGQNLSMIINKTPGGNIGTLDNNQITFLGGGNNGQMHFPLPGFPNPSNPDGYPLYNFQPNTDYYIQINGLSMDNAFQVLPAFNPGPTCGTTTYCTITAINNLNTSSSTINPGDPIKFTINIHGVPPGYVLGVNGPNWGGAGNVGNYLAPGSTFVRTPVPTDDNAFVVTRIRYDDTSPYDQVMYAPGSPGNYSFNWALVQPGVGWLNTTCSGTLTVTPPMVTIQGTVLDYEDIGIRYPGITIETCTGIYPVTDGNGSFSFNIPKGTGFCIRAANTPAHTIAAYIRPYAAGYGVCGGYGGNTPANACSAYGTYEFQQAGVAAGNGYDRWGDGSYDYGYDIAMVIEDIATCTGISINNLSNNAYPNNQYTVTVSYRNDGGKTWTPNSWHAGYHGWTSPGIDTNNYLSNGNPGIDQRMNWMAGNVAPGGTANFTATYTTPAVWDGHQYPLEFRMVRDLSPANGSGGYWMATPRSTTCATTLGVAQGSLFDTFNTARKRTGVINTCNYGSVRNNATTGWFSFVVPYGGYFCVDTASLDAGAASRQNVYPSGQSYGSCAANTWCNNVSSYQCQGIIPNTSCSGAPIRSSKNGYDLSVSSVPIITCGLGLPAYFDAGGTFTGPVIYSSSNTTTYTAPSVTGTATVAVSPTAGVTPTSATGTTTTNLAPGGNTGPNDIKINNPSGLTFNATGTYTLTGSFSGSGGGYINIGATPNCTQSTKVVESPYVRFYGGDVIVGASYDTPCVAQDASIAASSRSFGGDWRGAGTQYGAQANGSITGFATAMLTAPTNPALLAFANTAADTALTPPTMGGGMNAVECMKDYWPATLPTDTLASITPARAAAGGQYTMSSAGSTLTQGAADITKSMAIYVNGDLTIGSNLRTASSWTSVDDIPSLYIVVRGDIHIASGVTNIDAVLIAIPTASAGTAPNRTYTKGRIFTCYNSTDANTNSAWIAQNCATKLTVNGALVGARVNFLRAKGAIRSAPANETQGSANIAEVVQFPPELLMSTPALDKKNKSDKVDSIMSLHPNL